MRILVTGSNGLVGSRLASHLSQNKIHSVVGTSLGPQRVQGSYDYRTCDLTDSPNLFKLIKGVAPEAVIHCASMTDVNGCEKEPQRAYEVNVTVPASIAQASREVGFHLVYVSTDYVFDGLAGPYDEAATPHPKGVYATTKYMGELAVSLLSPSFAIARTAVVFGWPAAGRLNFGCWLVNLLEKKQPVALFEDQWVSPSFADNVALMLAEIAVRKLQGIWNVCGATVIDRFSFGKALCREFGFDDSLLRPGKMADIQSATPRPSRSGLKIDKVLGELTAKPLELSSALAQFHQAYLATSRTPDAQL